MKNQICDISISVYSTNTYNPTHLELDVILYSGLVSS